MYNKMELRETIISYLWVLFIPYITAGDASIAEVERHLEMGKQFLSKGQFADALTHYHAAVDADPDNYQTIYRRATVYLAMGKSKSALPDLDRVLELKPDFTAARMQRGNVLMKQGDLVRAADDFDTVLKVEPGNTEATDKKQLLEQIRLLRDEGNRLYNEGDISAAILHLTQAIEHSPWDPSLRDIRAECYQYADQLGQAVADIRATTKLVNDPTDAYLKISMLYYEMGDADESLKLESFLLIGVEFQIRECLKLNPDHKQCFAHYKKVKKLAKQLGEMNEASNAEDWMLCLERYEAALKTESKQPNILLVADTTACRCNAKAGHSTEAIQLCTTVLERDSKNVQTLCDRAEAYLIDEDYDAAIRDYRAALEIEDGLRRAREGINRAEKLQKQASRKDYYKILGVKRNASKRDITKAYRSLAQKWHPDNFNDEVEKKKAEAKFIDIAAAKEVLSDPEMRQKFDNGEDPLDPEQQNGRGGHPFGHGFNPFGHGGGGGGGGGPFTFKFHF